MPPIVSELEPGRTHLGGRAMLELRPHLGRTDEFVRVVDELQRPHGYRLVGSFEDGIDEAVAVAGFVVGHKLAWGAHIYIDDLVTLPDHRGRGHAAALLDWVAEEAGRLGCVGVQLDSGTPRHDAHRRYLTAGYRITSFHFARDV
jgi:GNAT superfamily N-acetyltransferase